MEIDLKHFNVDKPRKFYWLYHHHAKVSMNAYIRRIENGVSPIDALTVKRGSEASRNLNARHYWLTIARKNKVTQEQFDRNMEHGLSYEEAATSLFIFYREVKESRDLVLAKLLKHNCPIKPRDRSYVIDNKERFIKLVQIV